MKNASEGETQGIYFLGEGNGEICRGMDLSKGGEENPPRNLKNRRRGAVVVGNHPCIAGARLEKKVERINRRGTRACGYRQEPYMSDMSGRIWIYSKNSDLADFLQKSDLSWVYPI
jgi:hypothetical protein